MADKIIAFRIHPVLQMMHQTFSSNLEQVFISIRNVRNAAVKWTAWKDNLEHISDSLLLKVIIKSDIQGFSNLVTNQPTIWDNLNADLTLLKSSAERVKELIKENRNNLSELQQVYQQDKKHHQITPNEEQMITDTLAILDRTITAQEELLFHYQKSIDTLLYIRKKMTFSLKKLAKGIVGYLSPLE